MYVQRGYLVGNDVLASSDRYLEVHYEIAVSALSLEALHDETV